jgi:hypothetical protein
LWKERNVTRCLTATILAGGALLGSALVACGDTTKQAGDVAQTEHSSAVRPRGGGGGIVARLRGRLLGDEDDDDSRTAQRGGAKADDDADFDNDQLPKHEGYRDADDGAPRGVGRPATPSQARAIAAVTRRYYKAAAAADGVTACALVYPILAGAVAEDYGEQPSSPAEVRGNTCAVVMTALFHRYRAQLAARREIMAIRVNGIHARVLLGSETVPASSIGLIRQEGVWKIDNLFSNPLP